MNERPSSIDPAECAYFERLAGLWWNESGPFWPLHRMNSLRSEYIRERLLEVWPVNRSSEQPLRGLRILDIGCGGGILSEAVARMGAEVTGADVVAKNIAAARIHAAQSGLSVNYEVASAEMLCGRGDQYDVLLNMEVVEHVAELPIFLDACVKLLRPGGVIFVATINRTLRSWLVAILGAEYLLRWLPRGTHRWSKFPTHVELENLLQDRGLKVIGRTGVTVNIFTRHFRFTPSMAVNYMLVAQKPCA